MRVMVTGSTGFLGRRVVEALHADGHEVRCLVRTPGYEDRFQQRDLDIHYGSVSDMAALRAAIYDLDAVVHLVAIIRERGSATFDAVNRQGTQNVATVSAEAGVGHFVQVSAIGADDQSQYPYLRSKGQGEAEVVASGIPYSIIRPSILFGPGDEFVSTLGAIVKAFPMVPIIGTGSNMLQPIAVEDVARCIAIAVRDEPTMAPVEVGGPEHLSYLDIVRILCRTLNVTRGYMPVPLTFLQNSARIMEAILPSPPATREQLRMSVLPNVTEQDSVHQNFHFHPRPLEGNIDFIKTITRWDGLKVAVGIRPARLRGALPQGD
jgi:uncharacterized protein YbjT (DUF2867 family)